jgi:ribonuclease-3
LSSGFHYTFKDPGLLTVALTHRSADRQHNERLEFLGDAIIGFLVAEWLYGRFPAADEGQLTRTRAALVNRETLAAMARQLELGGVIALGEGELKSGGWRRDSILANALEAVLGAIYLDGGLDAAREVLLKWYGSRLQDIDPVAVQKDSKTRLQEFLQERHLPLPRYDTLDVEGPPHAQRFTVSCQITSPDTQVQAVGHSRRQAEQEAARLVLAQLQDGSAVS